MRESGEVHPERVGVPITARLWLMARRRVGLSTCSALLYIFFLMQAGKRKMTMQKNDHCRGRTCDIGVF